MKSFYLNLVAIILFSVAQSNADETLSPLDQSFRETTYGAESLYRTKDKVIYQLLAIESLVVDGQILSRHDQIYYQREEYQENHDDARNLNERERADTLCRVLGFKGSVRDTVKITLDSAKLFDINNRKLYTPETCFKASEEIQRELRQSHFFSSHSPIIDFQTIYKDQNDICSDVLVKAALTGHFALDQSTMTAQQAKDAEEAAKRITGFAPGKILHPASFSSLTCSDEPLDGK